MSSVELYWKSASSSKSTCHDGWGERGLEVKAMKLQTVHAIFKDGFLIFADPTLVPRDGTEVVVTYLEEPQIEGLMG